MKKYEAVYKIRNYIYKKDQFTLQELMDEFEISKSTALRYITALEDIGVPLYSEKGRYGGYRIMSTYRLPPITFTPQETYAMFFSIKGMELIESTPFQAEYHTIQEKFLEAVPPKIKSTLDHIKSRVSFGSVKITQECPLLEEVLKAIMEPAVLRIVYQTASKQSTRRIQPIGIFAENGSWYCPAFDMEKKAYRLFRCDRIKRIDVLEDRPLEDIMEFTLDNRFQLIEKNADAIDYKVEISAEGVSIYSIRHYPNMSLEETNGRFFIKGWIHPAEMDFLTTYLQQFGQFLISIYPDSLKQNFIGQLEALHNRMKDSENPFNR